MLESARPALVAFAAFVLGCGSVLAEPDGGAGGQGGSQADSGPDRPIDTAPDATPDGIVDAAACDCNVEDFTLTMSWACFCAKFGCAESQPSCLANRTWYPGCGLTVDTLDTVAGPNIAVWDANGVLVGGQYTSDTSYYQCPSDPSLQAGRVRAGRFPDASCPGAPCTCAEGQTTCAQPDAGVDARDGGSTDAGCSGSRVFCSVGSSGGTCSDVASPATCLDGQWTCPASTVPTTQCRCVGAPPPGCTCGSSGWSCATDAGSAP
jgi:hypothetical protein